MRRPTGGDRNRGVGAIGNNGVNGKSVNVGGGGSSKRGGGDAVRRRGGGPSFPTSNNNCNNSTMWLVLILHSLLIGAQFVLLAVIFYYGATNVILGPSSSVSSQQADGDELLVSPFNAKLVTRSGKFHPLTTKDVGDGSGGDIESLRKNYNNLRQRLDKLESQIGASNGNLAVTNNDDPDGIKAKLKELADIEKKNAAGSVSGGKKNLVFLHIGKSGGTSFDLTGKQLAKDVQMTYIGKKHFDWSFILDTVAGGTSMTPSTSTSSMNQRQHKLRENDQCQVITILREPVDRAISHFHFTKNQKWGGAIKSETLSQFLFNTSKQHLLDTRDIWQDGQAAVSWLTGTHIASWAQIPKDEVPMREQIASNYTKMCLLAAERLEQTRWFGLLEDIDRSLELLQWEFNLEKKPEMKKQNQNKVRKQSHPTNDDITQLEKEALASLMPQDIWLFEYAKLLFAARWNEYQTGIYIQPDKPPLPTEWPCTSTRFTLNCTSGPLVDAYEKPLPQKAE